MKPKEFYIFPPSANDAYEASGSVALSRKQYRKEIANNAIHIREVSPDCDAAIQKMVEALEKIHDIGYNSYGENTEECNLAGEALQAWKKVNE